MTRCWLNEDCTRGYHSTSLECRFPAMTPHAAQALVNTALRTQADLTTYVNHYRGVDLLSDSTYRGFLTDRDTAEDALVAALGRRWVVSESNEPEVWGDGCECWVTPEHMWTTHYGAVEPGSQFEFNPDCPEHGHTT